MLPHLSKEYRTLAETFDHALYGRTASYPRWLICSKVVRDWLPFAVDALQQQPPRQQFETMTSKSRGLNKTQGNEELLKLMFFSLRNQLKDSLSKPNGWSRRLGNLSKRNWTRCGCSLAYPMRYCSSPPILRNTTTNWYSIMCFSWSIWSGFGHSVDRRWKRSWDRWPYWMCKSCAMYICWSKNFLTLSPRSTHLSIPLSLATNSIVSEMYTRDNPQAIAYSNKLNMLLVSKVLISSITMTTDILCT